LLLDEASLDGGYDSAASSPMVHLLDTMVSSPIDGKTRHMTGTEFADHFSYHIILNEDCKIVHVGSAFKCAQCLTYARARTRTGRTYRLSCSKNGQHSIDSSP